MRQINANRKRRAPKSIAMNRRTRDENIQEFERRRPKAEKPIAKEEKKEMEKPITAEEIRKKLKPKLVKVEEAVSKRPFLILKPQKQLLVQSDDEIVKELNKTYRRESKRGDKSIRERGDMGQKNLRFTDLKSCPREVFYSFFEPHQARDYTVKGLILFEEGKLHHKDMGRRLEDSGRFIDAEGFLEIPTCGAVGYYDGLWEIDRVNGFKVCDMLEEKSKLPYACDEVAQEDYDQAQLYHHAAQYSPMLKKKRIKIRNIRLLYKDRAIQTEEVYFGWIAQPDKKRQLEVLQYLHWLNDVVIGQRALVPHPFERTSNKCIYCRYHKHCWKGYPEVVLEGPEEKAVPIPDKEIVESHAKRIYEIILQRSALKEELDKLAPVILAYLKKIKKGVYPINDVDGLTPRLSRDTVWDNDLLIKELGLECFAKIAAANGKLITKLIKEEFIDAGIFERAKKYKPKKAYLGVSKLKNFGKEVTNESD